MRCASPIISQAVVTLVLAALSGAIACGSDAPAASPPAAEVLAEPTAEPAAPAAEPPAAKPAEAVDSGPDPCALLLPEEIAPLFGTAAGPGVRRGRVCKWKPDSGPGSVTVQIEPDGQRVYAHEKKLLGADEELSGIGDEAFRSGLIIGVRTGERWVSVGVAPNIGKKMPKPADAVALAKQAIARLAAL